ncbi:amidohydrolase family protein (plasmid) [Halarchaeum sp. CBA1220]|uniref:dihydroorotase n=1 Tax=Halarchaeum sp. CBA1220 TaxID=1853682 RepID=UPI000F3A87D6|nr:amidohydrolase family protein [Halarchaeum sp. CBA1220]QLC35379.1 amidohydrolase family protein [Halarchaeum sp. CBA1220]
MTIDTIVRGGTVVTADGTYDADVAIDGETIHAVGEADAFPDAEEVVDASGKLVMPGVVDPHVHVHDPFSADTYESASRAAALGGTTTMIGFAFQRWGGDMGVIDGDDTLLEAIAAARERGEDALIDFSLHGAITEEDPAVLDALADVVADGVTSIKMFSTYDHGLSNGFMHRALEELADLDAVAALHTEDDSVCTMLTERFEAEGRGDPTDYPQSRPDYAEAMAAEDAVRMAQEAGAKYYGVHTSCRKSAEVLDAFRDDGSLVRTETCTHYTTLDDSVYADIGNQAMIAPPIRKPDDIEAMFEHLADGSIDIVSTDHCGYTSESKNVENWWDSTFGANALQTSLPVFHDEAVNERGFSYPFLVRAMCTRPAETFGMPEKGTLDPGTDADVVVFDPDATDTITAADNESIADFTIYEGRDVTGRVERTYVRGELVAADGDVVGDAGHGEFIEREIPDWSP